MSARFDARHERPLVCTDCGTTNIVGPHHHDIDPDTYLGVVCGCRRQKPRAEAAGLAAVIAKARDAQKAGH